MRCTIRRSREQPLRFVVPIVVPTVSSPTVAGNRARHHPPLNHNGQRWCALAASDYESRALPLSYGGGKAHNLAARCSMRYSTISGGGFYRGMTTS